VDSKITDTENGGEHSTCEGGTAGDGFILVESGRKELSGEDGLDLGANSGDTSASTNEFDSIDLLEGETSVLENVGEGTGYTIKDTGDEGLVLFPR